MAVPATPRVVAALSERIPAQTYLNLLSGVLLRVDENLATLSVGAHADSVAERAARKEIYDRLFDTRGHVIAAIGELQRIVHPGSKFTLGRIVITTGVSRLLGTETTRFIDTVVWRQHALGKWGDTDAHDRRVNDRALETGQRVISFHTIKGERLMVLTEADRSATTVLLSSEY